MIEYEHEDHPEHRYWFALPPSETRKISTSEKFQWVSDNNVSFRLGYLPTYKEQIGNIDEEQLKADHDNWKYHSHGLQFALSQVVHSKKMAKGDKGLVHAAWERQCPEPKTIDVLCLGFKSKDDAMLYKLTWGA